MPNRKEVTRQSREMHVHKLCKFCASLNINNAIKQNWISLPVHVVGHGSGKFSSGNFADLGVGGSILCTVQGI